MPALEKMSHPPVSRVPVPRVTEEKSVQDGGQRGWTDVDQVVNVSAHQHIGIQATVTPQSGFLKHLQISPSVGVIRKDPVAVMASADHMIQKRLDNTLAVVVPCPILRRTTGITQVNKACLTPLPLPHYLLPMTPFSLSFFHAPRMVVADSLIASNSESGRSAWLDAASRSRTNLFRNSRTRTGS